MFITAEIGGTKIQVAAGNADGSIATTLRGRVDADKGSRGILEWFRENTRRLIEQKEAEGAVLEGIGVGFGGPIDSSTGRVLRSMQIEGWSDCDLKGWFEGNFHLPTFVYNDSSAAGWGEYVLGSGRGTKQFFYTNMGTGVGGALILDGRLFDGQGVGAGELGQTRVPDWTGDAPGAEDRLEELCSGLGIETRLHRPGYVPEDSLLLKLAGGDLGKIDCRMLAEAVRAGDPFACQELDHVARAMATGIANVLCLAQPERVAVGGGISLMGDILFDRLRPEVKRREFISNEGRYEVVPCELGEAIVLQGALLLAAEAYRSGR